MSKELPVNRLATTDARGSRLWLYPADVRGKFRTWRTRVFAFLILVFAVLPWIRWEGRQAVLFDIPQRRFNVFGLTLWAHDAPVVIFILAGAAIGLAFLTAVFGRLWCGWACPQTVFIDGVFRRLERWIEGDAFVRRRLDEGPWTGTKIFKKCFKWTAFSVVSGAIAWTFLAYFVDARELGRALFLQPGDHELLVLSFVFFFGLTLFDFGWFREQFCTIACPYGRFQAVLMDSRSLAVLYDSGRGEPRKGTPGATAQGDCVNCYRCVQVCPTGIDIRRGVQLECIACTACVDACDEVMTRVGKPRGLIRYDSEAGMARKTGRWKLELQARGWIYLAILVLLGSGMTLVLMGKKTLDFTITRAIESPYTVAAVTERGRELVNHFRIDLDNRSRGEAEARLTLAPEFVSQGVELIVPMNPVPVAGGAGRRVDFFVRFPESILRAGQATMTLQVASRFRAGEPAAEEAVEVRLVGPIQ